MICGAAGEFVHPPHRRWSVLAMICLYWLSIRPRSIDRRARCENYETAPSSSSVGL